MSEFDDAMREISIVVNGSLIDGTRLHNAFRRGARAAIEKHAAEGDVAAKHIMAVEELERVTAERDNFRGERDSLAIENASLKARGP